jgi:hypothetical protein
VKRRDPFEIQLANASGERPDQARARSSMTTARPWEDTPGGGMWLTRCMLAAGCSRVWRQKGPRSLTPGLRRDIWPCVAFALAERFAGSRERPKPER